MEMASTHFSLTGEGCTHLALRLKSLESTSMIHSLPHWGVRSKCLRGQCCCPTHFQVGGEDRGDDFHLFQPDSWAWKWVGGRERIAEIGLQLFQPDSGVGVPIHFQVEMGESHFTILSLPSTWKWWAAKSALELFKPNSPVGPPINC